MKANPIYHDIADAPFKIGQAVRVVRLLDETADPKFLLCVGVVFSYEYNCGCGQTYPGNPMVGVAFGDLLEEFWPNELAAVDKASN